MAKKGILIAIVAVVLGFILLRHTYKGNPDASLKSLTKRTSENKQNENSESTNESKGEIPSFLTVPSGYTIHVFATGIDGARDLQFTPLGTLLVSSPSQNAVFALPDKDRNGVADETKEVISGFNHVHGLAFNNRMLYAVGVTSAKRFQWNENSLTADNDKQLFSLPQNGNHNNRTIVFGTNDQLFVNLGSTCNVCREDQMTGGSILTSDRDGNNLRVFSKGLRNAPFLAINPNTGQLWVTEMGRDNLGDNIPPDEINIAKEGADYGWPNCYGDKLHDDNFDQQNHSCANTETPIYQIPAHSAPLGLVFINSPQFDQWNGDILVALHGSWNRSTAIGYKVVRLKVEGNKITDSQDFITGFNPGTQRNDSLGRPVDVTFDSAGNLYVSDDKAGQVYIIQKSN